MKEPGSYYDIPFDEYASWDGMNQSLLKQGLQSMAHLRAAIDGERPEPTAEMKLGKLIHAGQLEPETLEDHYVVMPQFNMDPENKTAKGEPSTSWSTGYARKKAKEFAVHNAGKEIVSEDDFAKMEGVTESIAADVRAASCFRGGHPEVSVVWDDPDTGIRCKARLDYVNRFQVVDLKKCDPPWDFERAIDRYGYHIQAAFYLDGLRQVSDGQQDQFVFVVHETTEPYTVMTAPLDDAAIEFGRQEYTRLLEEYQACMECDEWPKRPSPSSWMLPQWAMKNQQYYTIPDTEVFGV